MTVVHGRAMGYTQGCWEDKSVLFLFLFLPFATYLHFRRNKALDHKRKIISFSKFWRDFI